MIVEGTSVLGDFGGESDPPAGPGPTVRIRGVAVLAAVAVEHRQIGESAGDAHRRRKAERRALRSQARAQLPRG